VSLSEELERLVAMRNAGHLSDEEFSHAKQAALTSSHAPDLDPSLGEESNPATMPYEDIEPVRTQDERVATRKELRMIRVAYFTTGVAAALIVVVAVGVAVYSRGTLVIDLNHRSGTLTNGASISSLEIVKDMQAASDSAKAQQSSDQSTAAADSSASQSSPPFSQGTMGVALPLSIGDKEFSVTLSDASRIPDLQTNVSVVVSASSGGPIDYSLSDFYLLTSTQERVSPSDTASRFGEGQLNNGESHRGIFVFGGSGDTSTLVFAPGGTILGEWTLNFK
jgi:hypothetical protein